MGDDTEKTPDEMLIQRVLSGDELARRTFVRRLTRVFRAVAWQELRPWPEGRMGERDVDDLVSDVFAMLFGDDAKALRKWDGRSQIETIGAVYARSRIRDIARKELRRLGLTGRPVSSDDVVETDRGVERPDELSEARDLAKAILACVEEALTTEQARELIDLILVRQWSTKAIVVKTGKTRQQIFRWRSRILQQARACWRKLSHG